MSVISQKSELIKWISSIEDPFILEQINQFKKQKQVQFENELKTAISGEELKKRTTNFLKSLDWKI